MEKDTREHIVKIRMSDKERRQLFNLAKETGISASDVVRLAVQESARKARRQRAA